MNGQMNKVVEQNSKYKSGQGTPRGSLGRKGPAQLASSITLTFRFYKTTFKLQACLIFCHLMPILSTEKKNCSYFSMSSP